MGKKALRMVLAVAVLLMLLAAGCSNTRNNSATGSDTGRVVHVGYYGGTCEAPIYAAYEQGIFKQNGLNVELVKLTSVTLADALATGKIDAVQITPGEFKGIEQGENIKITDGVHTGCIQAVAPVNSAIKSIAGLKGKTIGTDSTGGVPMALLSMEMLKLGIDPKTDVTWKVYPPAQLSLAMDKGEIDAFATWDPFGQMAINDGKARAFFSNTSSAPYAGQFCCYVGINGNVVTNEPQIAKALTKSFAEAGQWVAAHPQEAAQLEVDKQYTGGDAALNGALLSKYKYISDPALAKTSYTSYLNGMKQLEMLDPATKVDVMVQQTFVDLSDGKGYTAVGWQPAAAGETPACWQPATSGNNTQNNRQAFRLLPGSILNGRNG